MPLLRDLSRGVRDTLASQKIEIGPDLDAIDNVEHWLTLLADPAPWLSYAEQQRNSALFSEVSQAIFDVLTAMQVTASLEAPPTWLLPLVKYWHRMQSTVITFNYDFLVELAYLQAVSPDPGSTNVPSDLYSIPVTPAALRVAPVYGHKKRETFRLLKLHGSLDWWYSGPQAEASDPIYGMAWTGNFAHGITWHWGDIGGRLLVEDKFPMLIPPAATKTPFYRNRLIARQWAQAGEALNQADELVMMGYSAPLTDLTVSTLIATQFKGSTIIPVNRDRSVVDRLEELRSKVNLPTVLDVFIDDAAIENWVVTFASEPDAS